MAGARPRSDRAGLAHRAGRRSPGLRCACLGPDRASSTGSRRRRGPATIRTRRATRLGCHGGNHPRNRLASGPMRGPAPHVTTRSPSSATVAVRTSCAAGPGQALATLAIQHCRSYPAPPSSPAHRLPATPHRRWLDGSRARRPYSRPHREERAVNGTSTRRDVEPEIRRSVRAGTTTTREWVREPGDP